MLRRAAAGPLASLPLIRHWWLPDDDARAAAAPPSASPASPSKPPAMLPQQTNSPSPTQSSTRGGAMSDAGTAQAAPSHWLLFPRQPQSGSCKLTVSAPAPAASRLVDSCWHLEGPSGGAAVGREQEEQEEEEEARRGSSFASEAAEAGRRRAAEAAEATQRFVEGCAEQAAAIVRGLASPRKLDDDEEEDEAAGGVNGGASEAPAEERRGAGRGPGAAPLAWDAVTPDGLPVLGWHPGFEAGRVLVACTAGSHAGGIPPPPPPPPPPPAGAGAATTQRDGSAVSLGWQAQSGDGLVAGRASAPPGGAEEPGACLGTAHDGLHLSPLLAKAAADLLLGVTALPFADVERLRVERLVWAPPAGGVAGRAPAVDPWEQLGVLQAGGGRAAR